MSALKQLAHYARPYRFKLALASISSALNKACDIVPEILIGLAIDIIVNQQHSITAHISGITDPFQQLYVVATLTAVLWIFESIFEYCYLILWRSLAQRIQHDLRIKLYDHIQHLDMAYFENKTTGGLLAIVNDDVNELEQFLSTTPNAIIQLAVNIVVMGFIFSYLSPLLAALTLLPIPFVIAMAFYFQKRLAALYEKVRECLESLSGHIAGRLMGIATIKSYTTEHYEVACLAKESMRYQQANKAANNVNAAYIPLVRMWILAGFIISMIIGGQYALTGILSISAYSVLVFLTQRFLWPFTELAQITDTYERAMASARRIFAVLAHQNIILGGDKKLENTEDALVFDRVSFSYANGTRIFQNLSLTIPAKKTIAFVGATGSGKSTLIKLILRFYDAQSGTITWGEQKITNLAIKQLRQAIGLVSQEVYLINASVADNIAYGCSDANQDKVIDAATMAQAHDFIMQLPQGYNTIIQEGGKNLSGGQRQRISIARAIYKQPALFIFDEATSALDNDTELAIQQSLATLAGQHTMIIIAHRLSTVRHADTIVVLDKGTIIESGTHDQLVQLNGTYAKLWKIQTGTMQ